MSCGESKLQEFTTHGTLLRNIQLPLGIKNPYHAIDLPNGQFVVSCSGSFHSVRLVDTRSSYSKLWTKDRFSVDEDEWSCAFSDGQSRKHSCCWPVEQQTVGDRSFTDECSWDVCVCWKVWMVHSVCGMTNYVIVCKSVNRKEVEVDWLSLIPGRTSTRLTDLVTSHAVVPTDLYIFIQMPYIFRFIFSGNLQPIATRGKKARGTLLVDKHWGNGCCIKRASLSVSY